jgi:transitional endoplasmic reticulum ATPase
MTVGTCNKCGEHKELVLADSVCASCIDALDKQSQDAKATDWVLIDLHHGFQGVYRNTTYAEMKLNWAKWDWDNTVTGKLTRLCGLSPQLPAHAALIRPATPEEIADHDEHLRREATIPEPLTVEGKLIKPAFGESGHEDETWGRFERRLSRYCEVRDAWVIKQAITEFERVETAMHQELLDQRSGGATREVTISGHGLPIKPDFGESGHEDETEAGFERRLSRYEEVRDAWMIEQAIAEFQRVETAKHQELLDQKSAGATDEVPTSRRGLLTKPVFGESGHEEETWDEFERRFSRYRDAWVIEQAIAEFQRVRTAKPLDQRSAGVAKEVAISRRGLSQVAGMTNLKEQLMHEVTGPLKDPALYHRYRVSLPNGILFFGPPGCGKTYLARCLAEELGWHFQYCRPSDVASPYIHETVSRIRAVFSTAIEKAPSIVFIDEFEAFVPARSELGGHQQYKAEEVNEFLSNLEGCAERKVLVIAATNEPEKIDPAVRRSGRFDKLILIPPPDAEARRAMLEFHLSGRPVEAGLDAAGICAVLEGYSASDIKLLVDESARMALKQTQLITTNTLLAALERVPASITAEDMQRYSRFRSRGTF